MFKHAGGVSARASTPSPFYENCALLVMYDENFAVFRKEQPRFPQQKLKSIQNCCRFHRKGLWGWFFYTDRKTLFLFSAEKIRTLSWKHPIFASKI